MKSNAKGAAHAVPFYRIRLFLAPTPNSTELGELMCDVVVPGTGLVVQDLTMLMSVLSTKKGRSTAGCLKSGRKSA